MTPAQLTTLKAHMHAPAQAAALGAWLAAADWVSIAGWYNQLNGATVWKPQVTVSDLSRNIVGSAFDALSVQKQNGYLAITQGGFVDATSQNIRSWFQDIFGAGATLTALTAESQKPATRFEMVFATAAAPSNVTTVFGQTVTAEDCRMAEMQV